MNEYFLRSFTFEIRDRWPACLNKIKMFIFICMQAERLIVDATTTAGCVIASAAERTAN